MKFSFNLFNVKKFPADIVIEHEIEFIKKIIEIINSRQNKNNFLELEINFRKYCDSINEKIIANGNLPPYWADFYEICMNLKSTYLILKQLYLKIEIYGNEINLNNLLEKENEFLDNIKLYFSNFIDNYKYASEILKNNQYLLDKLGELYIEILKSTMFKNFDAVKHYSIYKSFDKINGFNQIIQNKLNKINLSILI